MGLLKNDYVLAFIWALCAGVSCVFGFAPFGIFPIPVLALAVLFALWQRAGTPRIAAWLGFAFGLGLFGAGVGWIYVALHDYGDMPMLLALPATMLFARIPCAVHCVGRLCASAISSGKRFAHNFGYAGSMGVGRMAARHDLHRFSMVDFGLCAQ